MDFKIFSSGFNSLVDLLPLDQSICQIFSEFYLLNYTLRGVFLFYE